MQHSHVLNQGITTDAFIAVINMQLDEGDAQAVGTAVLVPRVREQKDRLLLSFLCNQVDGITLFPFFKCFILKGIHFGKTYRPLSH